jgi:hypothetical protein
VRVFDRNEVMAYSPGRRRKKKAMVSRLATVDAVWVFLAR